MTPNKYHGSGRHYTAAELKARRWAILPTYVRCGYRRDGKPEALLMPHRNSDRANKRKV